MAIFPPSKRRRAKILGVGGGLLCILALFACATLYGVRCNRSREVLVFVPDGWAGLHGNIQLTTIVDGSQYILRRAHSNDDSGDEEWAYFRLDVVKRELHVATPPNWCFDPERTVDCQDTIPLNARLGPMGLSVSKIYTRTHALKKAGARLISIVFSPSVRRVWAYSRLQGPPIDGDVASDRREVSGRRSENLASIVSAVPDWQLSVGFFGTVKGSSRQHYHQILSLDDFTFRGKALRIPMVTAGPPFSPGRDYLENVCWTADERYVILIGRYTLCVFPTGLHETGD